MTKKIAELNLSSITKEENKECDILITSKECLTALFQLSTTVAISKRIKCVDSAKLYSNLFEADGKSLTRNTKSNLRICCYKKKQIIFTNVNTNFKLRQNFLNRQQIFIIDILLLYFLGISRNLDMAHAFIKIRMSEKLSFAYFQHLSQACYEDRTWSLLLRRRQLR